MFAAVTWRRRDSETYVLRLSPQWARGRRTTRHRPPAAIEPLTTRREHWASEWAQSCYDTCETRQAPVAWSAVPGKVKAARTALSLWHPRRALASLLPGRAHQHFTDRLQATRGLLQFDDGSVTPTHRVSPSVPGREWFVLGCFCVSQGRRQEATREGSAGHTASWYTSTRGCYI